MFKKNLQNLINEVIKENDISHLAKKADIDISQYKIDQLIKGVEVEKEHDTNDEIDVRPRLL